MSINSWKFSARLFVFTWFFVGGVSHFAFPQSFIKIVPPYIPYPELCVFVSGAFELLGAFGLWIKSLRSLAGYGLMCLTVVITLANVQMYLHPELFPSIPEWLLILRFTIQALLIWLIWWCSRPEYKGLAITHQL